MNGKLDRFLRAQEKMYHIAYEEIKNGKKESHYMWYIFPQLKGIGKSPMSSYYGIDDILQAKEYLNNDILKDHLLSLCHLLLDFDDKDITDIFDYPDDLKLQSCMTLFRLVNPQIPEFNQILEKYYKGEADALTLRLTGDYG